MSQSSPQKMILEGNSVTQEERTAAIQVARWLIVALPQDLADALDRYAASLEPEATPAEAARLVLRAVLLRREPPRAPAGSPHDS